jgi:hypothetical protein
LHIGDHLEVIHPSSAGTPPPPRFRCLGVDLAPRVTGRDPTLGYPIAIFIGADIEPGAIRAGAKLRAAGPLGASLTPVTGSPPRSLAEAPARRSGRVEAWSVQIPKLIVRVRFPSPAQTKGS